VSVNVTNLLSLSYPFLTNFLDLRFIRPLHISYNLITRCFASFTSDKTVSKGVYTSYITYYALNKDSSVIDPSTFSNTGPNDLSKGLYDTTANFYLAITVTKKET